MKKELSNTPNKLLHTIATLALLVLIIFFATGCQTVKPYQRVYLNDDNMQAGKQAIKTYTGHVHNYREGASGGGDTKGSGGCGCN